MIKIVNSKHQTVNSKWNLKSILVSNFSFLFSSHLRAFTPTPTFKIDHETSFSFILKNIFKCSFLCKRKLVRGFTLIETMVGIVIIVTAIIGPLSVAVTSATYAKDTKDKITAIYLAQEAADILRFERDSLLIKCNQANTDSASICPQYSLNDGNNIPKYGIDSYETTSNAAWRMFKKNLTGCFVITDADKGCAFDFYGFTNLSRFLSSQPPLTPTTYSPTDTNCDYLYRDEATTNNQTGGAYLCNGSVASPSSTFKKTRFQRTVKLKSIKTIDVESKYLTDYNDDVRVNVVVNYGKPFGLVKSVEVVDFLHAKI